MSERESLVFCLLILFCWANSSASALFHHKRKLVVPHVSNEGNILIRRFPSLMKLFSWWVYAFNQDSLKRI